MMTMIGLLVASYGAASFIIKVRDEGIISPSRIGLFMLGIILI